MLAVLADSEARSTATLVEVMAATALFKLAPPEGEDVATIEISEGDINEAMTSFFYEASYADGVMTVRVSRRMASLNSGQSGDAAEVTSDS